jgi:hypothetical protein
MPPIAPVCINRILDLGPHYVEFLDDGSVDIVDSANIGNPKEYVHLDSEQAYLLFTALYEKFKMQ